MYRIQAENMRSAYYIGMMKKELIPVPDLKDIPDPTASASETDRQMILTLSRPPKDWCFESGSGSNHTGKITSFGLFFILLFSGRI